MRKICVITGSRAEYGLLKLLISNIQNSRTLKLQLVVTGMHVSPEFGLTYKEIEEDGFKIDRRVEMLLSSDSPVGIAKSIGLGIIAFADVFDALKPDIILILGDRYEIFAAASAALPARIPIAHIHGGEITKGSIDEAIRHSLTKMSHLHFVACLEFKQRVIQLGEDFNNVYNVGGLGIDNIAKTPLLSKNELEKQLGFKFIQKNILITFHPVTLEKDSAKQQITELIDALEKFKDIFLIFTMPNADTEGRILIQIIKNYISRRHNAISFISLGQTKYFSCLKFVDGVVGNSSSGLLEVPSFKKGTINIGDRQAGRLKAESVIDCKPTKNSIVQAIKKLYSSEFTNSLKNVVNPYGKVGASNKICKILEKRNTKNLIKKDFHDLHL